MTHELLKKMLRPCWIAVAATLTALLARYLFLGALEHRIVWVTFYPMVVVASVYGGIVSGMLTAGLACAAAYYLWPLFASRPFIEGSADWLGVAAFLLNCLLIAAVAESMRRAKIRAEEARIEADKANLAKSRFLASMSHELRTPLNAIMGFSELLQYEPQFSDGQLQQLVYINNSGKHLLQLINDILDMSRIEAGRDRIELTEVDPAAMLQELVSIMQERANARGLELNADCTALPPLTISTDQTKLRQILINLIGNAIKFTGTGSITVRGMLKESDGQRGLIQIEVQDTGSGIDAQEQERIFEPFVQLEQPTGQKGTGLGLAITRSYLALLGGRIELESIPGSGSLFRILLPATVLTKPTTVETENRPARIAGLQQGAGMRILVVDDESINWQLLKKLLEMVGFTVKTASNGQEAVELFSQWHPDLIWMDCRMPVMDGLEATRCIRALEGGKAVPIIGVTASVFREDRDKVLAAGMNDFVGKPFTTHEIYDCMQKHLPVVYRYETSGGRGDGSLAALDQSLICGLPAALRSDLRAALLAGRPEQIRQALAAIATVNQSLADQLSDHVESMQYTQLYQALQHCGEER